MGARWLGIVTMALPLIVTRRFGTARPAIWFAMTAGLLESTGFLGFLWGAGDNVGVAAVMATQYATVATLISWVVLRERLSRVQIGGVGVVVLGVIILAIGDM
jgi:drug/metabolite transporter (DMT)-like permease